MKKLFEQVKATPLFDGITYSEFEQLLTCMEYNKCTYQKGEIILMSGNPVLSIGIVLSGIVHVLRESPDGKQNLMSEFRNGELFGESFACAGILHSPVTVSAAADCEILHIHYQKVITTCPSACPFHLQLVKNMLTLIAHKNLLLNQKIEIISKRTTRERLLLYFDTQRQGKRQFTIPLNREELAAFLCVERSAMSAELSKMQRDGIIRYNRREIEIMDIC